MDPYNNSNQIIITFDTDQVPPIPVLYQGAAFDKTYIIKDNKLIIGNQFKHIDIKTITDLVYNLVNFSYIVKLVQDNGSAEYKAKAIEYSTNLTQTLRTDPKLINYIQFLISFLNLNNLEFYFIYLYNQIYLKQYFNGNTLLDAKLLEYTSLNRKAGITNTLLKSETLTFNKFGWTHAIIERGSIIAKIMSNADLKLNNSKYKSKTITVTRFNEILHNINELLINVPGLVVAGGAIVNALLGSTIIGIDGAKHNFDIDFFIYGNVDIEKNIQLIINYFKNIKAKNRQFYITKNALTIVINNMQEYQIILRKYATMDEILHGFDLSCSQVLYDGNYFYYTHAAANSFNNNITMVEPITWYYSFEKRIQKYFNRGFAFFLPFVRPGIRTTPYIFNYDESNIINTDPQFNALKLKHLQFNKIAPFNMIDYHGELKEEIKKIQDIKRNGKDISSLLREFDQERAQQYHLSFKYMATKIKILYPDFVQPELKVESDYFTSKQLDYTNDYNISYYNLTAIRNLLDGKFGYLVGKLSDEQINNFKINDQFKVYFNDDVEAELPFSGPELDRYKYLTVEIQTVNEGTVIAYGKDPNRGKDIVDWMGSPRIVEIRRNKGEDDDY